MTADRAGPGTRVEVAEAAMEFRILGPIDVLDDAGVRLVIGGARERGLLALLLLSANQVVSTDRLVEGLWGEHRTGGAVHALRVHVSRLRRALRAAGRDDLLLTRPHGYLLRVEPEAIDAARFETLLSTARQQAAQNDRAGAADTLRRALTHWRGPALADVLDAPFVRSQAARLEETRLGALEQRIDHDLACGRHTELVAELAELTTTSPLRERLWSALMLALYRSGRQADALSTYQNLRTLLHDELGLEPSSTLAGLHTSILNQHPQLDWSPPPPGQHPTQPDLTPSPGSRPGEGIGTPFPDSESEPPRTRYATTDRVHIAYQVVGQGPVDVVLVPGFVSNIDLYWNNPGWRQVFDRLTRFCRLILWDKRGTGLSDPVYRVPTLDERVDDLLAVMDAAGSHHATLLGISEGGPMSLLFAASHPDRVRSLVLYGVSPRFSQARDWAWGWAPATVDSVLAELDADWGEGALLGLFAPSQADDDTARRSWGRTQRAGASPAMGRAVMEAMVTLDCRDILTAVRVPTLLLHRRDDQVAHIEAARYMAAQVPDARLVEFPGTNHLITMGHLEPLLDQIEDFVTTGTDRVVTDQLLATLLAATIVSPTAAAPLCGQPNTQPDPQTVLNRQNGLLHQELTRFGGQQVWTSEECWLAAFMSPSRAIACANRIRTGLTALGLHLRAGIHTGECDVTDGAMSGPPIQVAAQVAALADLDEVLITSTVRDLIAGTHLTFIPHDVAQLPGARTESTLYAIINTDQGSGP